jgi:hypothetical protein
MKLKTLTEAFLLLGLTTLVGCHTQSSRLDNMDEVDPNSTIMNNFTIWKTASSNVKANLYGPEATEPLQQEAERAALKRGFKLCSTWSSTQRSFDETNRELHEMAYQQPAEKFVGIFTYITDPEIDGTAWIYSTHCP